MKGKGDDPVVLWNYSKTSEKDSNKNEYYIYNFAIEDTEGIRFLNILSNGKYNYFKEVMPSIPSASKTGFAD